MVPNRYLPHWLHRLANGAVGAILSSLTAMALVRFLSAPLWALWLMLPVVLICTALDPRRISLVEGCAGDIGYDGLVVDDAEKPNTLDRDQAFEP
jgi:hypothetical protein